MRVQQPGWHIDDHYNMEWAGHPRNTWPEADLVFERQERRFIVEYDEDSDPGRSLVKYWPILHKESKVPLTIIEVWKRGSTVGHSQVELAKWMGQGLSNCTRPLPISSSRGKTRQQKR